MGSDLYTHTKMAKAVKTSPVNQVLNGRSQRIDQKEVEGINCARATVSFLELILPVSWAKLS